MLYLCFIIIPIIAGVTLYLAPKSVHNIAILCIETPLLMLAVYGLFSANSTGVIRYVLGADNPILGIELIFGKTNLFLIALLIILFTCGFVYSFKDDFLDGKFILLYFVLQGLLSGIFVSDDLFNLYVLLEVATVIVTILIMFKKDSYAIYDGIIYLFSQILCMLFYLFGIGYMYKIFGVLSISAIRQMLPSVSASELVLPFAFIMTAICLKSALFPLFSWLPRAHGTPSAPSAVSAILSGIYVKNGIYLFSVFIALFKPVIDMSYFFMIIGITTSILGFTFALAQTDIKLILAFSTISQVGLIALGFAIPNEISSMGAMYHIVNHAIFKALLFLGAGAIIKSYGTRDIRLISGVIKNIPVVGYTTLFGVLAMTGAPFFNASVSKYFIQSGTYGTMLEPIIHVMNFGTILTFIKYSKILFGDAQKGAKLHFSKNAVLCSLAFLCVLTGVFGKEIMNFLFNENLTINIISYAEKAVIYLAMLISGWFIYKYFITKSIFISNLRSLSLNFLQIVICIVCFFISISVLTAMQYTEITLPLLF